MYLCMNIHALFMHICVSSELRPTPAPSPLLSFYFFSFSLSLFYFALLTAAAVAVWAMLPLILIPRLRQDAFKLFTLANVNGVTGAVWKMSVYTHISFERELVCLPIWSAKMTGSGYICLAGSGLPRPGLGWAAIDDAADFDCSLCCVRKKEVLHIFMVSQTRSNDGPRFECLAQ